MPTSQNADLTDLEKIYQSLSAITSISSFDDVLAAFGLLDMPTAQKYGIVFGIFTFILTCVAVLALLTMGGTWERIEQQAKSGASATAPDSVTQRKRRALLLERLLENREWMMKTNYPKSGEEDKQGDEKKKFTNLTTMLMTQAPKEGEVIPEGYEKNYKSAYRRCQDKPGGETSVSCAIKLSLFQIYADLLTALICTMI